MKYITSVIFCLILVSSYSRGDLTAEETSKKYSRLGFLQPIKEKAGKYYLVEIGFQDAAHTKIMYLVNSIRVTEIQLYDLLTESFRRDPEVEVKVNVFKNLTIEQMLMHTRGLIAPQSPKGFPKVRVYLGATKNESIFHIREVEFKLSERQKSQIEKLRLDGVEFPYRINQRK